MMLSWFFGTAISTFLLSFLPNLPPVSCTVCVVKEPEYREHCTILALNLIPRILPKLRCILVSTLISILAPTRAEPSMGDHN
uniref:Putative secreted protein n=1 Tax=Anopheles marajoara TaxID=58244 RepID=A0A2M4CBD2_9DIPT